MCWAPSAGPGTGMTSMEAGARGEVTGPLEQGTSSWDCVTAQELCDRCRVYSEARGSSPLRQNTET